MKPVKAGNQGHLHLKPGVRQIDVYRAEFENITSRAELQTGLRRLKLTGVGAGLYDKDFVQLKEPTNLDGSSLSKHRVKPGGLVIENSNGLFYAEPGEINKIDFLS